MHHDHSTLNPIHTTPGQAEEGHHDGFICLSEWKAFFEWCTEHGAGEKYLTIAEHLADETFDARVDAVFKALDSDHSGELSIDEMERVFGEETHEFWVDMDGEISV